MALQGKASTIAPEEFLKKAVQVASYYGFAPSSQFFSSGATRARSAAASVPKVLPEMRRIDSLGGTFVGIARRYAESGAASSAPTPTLVYHSNLDAALQSPPKHISFSLHVLGVQKSIAEALVLQTSLAILDELGVRDKTVHINSLGDRDSVQRYMRAAGLYFKKEIAELSPRARHALQQDIFHALEQFTENDHAACADAPKPIEFLTEGSRRHLREVLEYLDTVDTPYEIQPTLSGHHDCYCQTLFEIRDAARGAFEDGSAQSGAVYAKGGRYDELGKKLFRLTIPAVGAVFTLESKKKSRYAPPAAPKRKRNIFFVQLGSEARMRSLSILETLRRQHIHVLQSLGTEGLSEQLLLAEEAGSNHTIIVGHKEALEGTAIVRNMDTHAQETVPVAMLPVYLKQLA